MNFGYSCANPLGHLLLFGILMHGEVAYPQSSILEYKNQPIEIKKNKAELSNQLIAKIANSEPQDIVVEYDVKAIENSANRKSGDSKKPQTSFDKIEFLAAEYKKIKEEVDLTLPAGEFETRQDYSHLPIKIITIKSKAVLDILLAHPKVKRIYEVKSSKPFR